MEFLATHFWTIMAVLGSLGTAATIALLVLFGVPFIAAIGYLVGAIKALFQFLKTPVGQVVGIALLCGACVFAGDMIGTRRQSAKCHEAQREAELAAARRDIDAHKAAADSANRTATELQTYADQLETKVQSYEAELAKRPKNAACAATQGDIRRLKDLAR